MQRQDGELDLPGPSAQPRRTVLLQKQAPARYLSCTSGGTRVSDGTLTPADLIPGYLGTDTARASPQFGLDRAAQRCQRGGHVVAHPGHAHASLALRVADRDVGNGEPVHGNAELKVRDTSDDNHAGTLRFLRAANAVGAFAYPPVRHSGHFAREHGRRVSEGARRWSHGKRRAGGGHATTNKKGIRL
jgi:hypothetical protein